VVVVIIIELVEVVIDCEVKDRLCILLLLTHSSILWLHFDTEREVIVIVPPGKLRWNARTQNGAEA